MDPKSRHKGKLETESLLVSKGVNWTSLRPVYIYGPLNCNPVEEWFFHRLKAGRPIPIPNSGNQITQLGHVKVGSNTCCHTVNPSYELPWYDAIPFLLFTNGIQLC